MGFCSNLGARWLFSTPAGYYWVHIDWLAPGHPMGAGNPTISWETETQVLATCQPQPRQPHIIKLISQLQKLTRKITDTLIIDTGKRETRYRLVKIHQTIRQPHNTSKSNTLRWKIIIRVRTRWDKELGLPVTQRNSSCVVPKELNTLLITHLQVYTYII